MSDIQSTVIRSLDDILRERLGRRTPVLVVIQGQDLGRRYLLNESRLLLGRDPYEAAILLPDPAVSARHAAIEASPDERFVLRDLDSRNGTFVNGERVEERDLASDDRILVGSTILKFTFQDAIEEDFHHQIDQLMNVDELTGLKVKRLFDLEYETAFGQALRSGHPLAVLMMDMDGLKSINDTHGHHMGAHCIARVGEILGAALRGRGTACRFGGDEFSAFLPDHDLEDALAVGESIRRQVEEASFELDGVAVHPTLSIGAAALGPEVTSGQHLVRRADGALYRAKRAGRNRVAS